MLIVHCNICIHFEMNLKFEQYNRASRILLHAMCMTRNDLGEPLYM